MNAAAPLLIGLTALRLLIAARLPLSPDEAYYWVWSRALAPGYLDHPPMVALWVRLGTAIAGEGALGIRLLAPIAALLGTILLARAAEDLLPGRRAGWTAGLLLNATLLFGAGAVTMTPDTPLLFFWTAALWALARLHATGRGGWWLVAGAMTGAALASKYTAALLPLGVLAWLLSRPEGRAWLRRPEAWLGAALAWAIVTPVVGWNAGHGWAGFIKQGGRAGAFDLSRAPQFLGELLGGQIALATPVIAMLCAAGVVAAARRWRDPAWGLLAALTLPGAALFLQHALGDRVQANWPAPLYPAAAIAAAGLAGGWRRWIAPGAALGAAMTLLATVQATWAPLALPVKFDPTLLRLAGWDRLAADLDAARDGASFIAADNYGIASLLALRLPGATPVIGAEPRWALFDLPRADLAGRTGLLVRSARRDDAPDPAPWASIERLGTIDRARDGMVAETFRLYRVTGRADGAVVLLPRPGGSP